MALNPYLPMQKIVPKGKVKKKTRKVVKAQPIAPQQRPVRY